MLSPTERVEFEVRNSPAAKYLRQAMLGLDVMEAEFRVLLEARKEFDAQLTSATAGEGRWLRARHFRSNSSRQWDRNGPPCWNVASRRSFRSSWPRE